MGRYRIDTLLDKAKSRLRLDAQDDQLSRRFAQGEPRHVEHDEAEETLHRRLSRFL